MDEDKATSGSGLVSRKKTRGPTPCGDMLKDFTIYLGSVVRFQVDINSESWDAVNQGLKDVIWDDIKFGVLNLLRGSKSYYLSWVLDFLGRGGFLLQV
ncbi:hypothetical protein ACET3Z_001419 [Daucus carota]